MTPRRRRVRGLLAAIVVAGTAAIVVTLAVLHDRVSGIRAGGQDNPIWVVDQLHFELLRFDNAAGDFANGDATFDELSHRFDLLWSRVNTLREGWVAQHLRTEGIDTSVVDAIRSELQSLDAQIFSAVASSDIDDNRSGMAEQLRGAFDPYKDDVREFSLNVLHAETTLQSDLRQSLLAASFWMTILNIIVVGVLGAFGIFLWVDGMRSRMIAREMEGLARDATASMRAKDNFISVVSHELRTPLTSIYGSLEMMTASSTHPSGSKEDRLVRIALRNCNRLLTLVGDILDIEKLDAGNIDLERSEFDLAATVRESIVSNESYASGLGVQLELTEVDAPLPIDGDEGRISQVLANLISNASKFSSTDSRVEVVVRRRGARGRVEVRDYGPGIPEEERDKIFERFHQGTQPTNTTYKGTGLGLSIAKRIIELHDGTIGFDSNLNQGSTFWVELDLAA